MTARREEWSGGDRASARGGEHQRGGGVMEGTNRSADRGQSASHAEKRGREEDGNGFQLEPKEEEEKVVMMMMR